MILGDVTVGVMSSDKIQEGQDPARIWVKVSNMSHGLKNREALAYLVHEFVTLLEYDIPTFYGTDLCWCRVMLEVPHEKVILVYQWIEYTHRSGEKKVFKVVFTIDQDAIRSIFAFTKAYSYVLGACFKGWQEMVSI